MGHVLMDQLLVTCSPLTIQIENRQQQVYLCKFCYYITLHPDTSHQCPNPDSPEELKQKSNYAYYTPTTFDLIENKGAVIYERVIDC